MTAPTLVSLCSGYGGLDLAVEVVFGARTVAHCEWEAAPSKVLAARWPGVPNLGDVKTADWSDWARADILSAGYPCQPFSQAGRRKGSDDERHLWPHVAEAIRRIRPRYVVLENVAGHRTLGLDAVLADLAALGYGARWTSLRAADVGAPHGRERLFILATDTRGEPAGQRRGRPYDDRVSESAAHSDLEGSQRSEPATGRDVPARSASANAQGDGRDEGRSESARVVGGPDAALRRGAVTPDTDGGGLQGVGRLEPVGRDADGRRGADVAWGDYEPAIRRWERVLGRVAPAPTELGPKGGQRLAPRFVEWMMGLPAGWVTDVPGISRNAQLKMLGNGVVPQQAAEALRRMLLSADVEAVA